MTSSIRRISTNSVHLFIALIVGIAIVGAAAPARAAGLFVSSFGDSKVNLLDSTTGVLVRTYSDPHLKSPAGLALSADGNILYVGNSNSANDVVMFNARTGAYIQSFANATLNYASGVALRNNGQSLLVGSPDNSAIYEFNTTTGASALAFGVANKPFDLELKADESALYVATGGWGGDTVIRKPLPSGASTTFTLPQFSAPYGLALSPNETILYATLLNDGATNTNMIAVLNATTGARTGTFTIPGPLGDMAGLDISDDGATLFASDSFNDLLYRIDTATGVATPFPITTALAEPAYILFTGDSTLIPEPSSACIFMAVILLGVRQRREQR